MNRLFALIILILITSGITSGELPELKLKSSVDKTFIIKQNKFEFNSDISGYRSIALIDSHKLIKDTLIVRKEKKSVITGALLSAILPGAGQVYAKSYVKAVIFGAVEVLAWSTFLYLNNKGDNQTESYQSFANQHWSVRRYGQWLHDNFAEGAGINPNEPDLEELRQQIIVVEQDLGFSHTLPVYNSQQFYELIGKYQTFMGGWEDATGVITAENFQTAKTQMFLFYADERQKANDFYDYAKIGSFTAILNHILSAADAAWTISRYNNSLNVKTSIRIIPHEKLYGGFEMVPKLFVNVNF